MHSELFQLGPLTIRAFGLALACGFAASLWVGSRLAVRRYGGNGEFFATLATWMIVAGVIGARVAYVAEHWSAEFLPAIGQGDVLSPLRIDQGGLMFYGGLVGATLALFIYARVAHHSFCGLADLVVTVLPLGHAFGRLGCFMHGCCYGRVSHSFLSVSFPKYSPAWYDHVQNGLLKEAALHSLPILPTQLFEAAGNFLIFAVLVAFYRQWSARCGLITGIYCLVYALLRFTVEGFRGDPRMAVGVLSISQAGSVVLAVAGIVFLCVALRSKRHHETADPV